ncbi:hypothetical protein MKX29_13450 [Cytobacillus sp. FSL R7-0696]|uniref:hypothetical protein n=1 Tax=Cytobacillus sp. FSL R7-0696 TaxID=2921691 RepID=UPI0030F95398
MRFDDRITFVKEKESYYDPVQGEWIEGELIKKTLPCKLSNLGITRTAELFGSIDKRVTVARLQVPFVGPIDYALINEQKYQIKRRSDYRKGVFYLEGIANG